MLIGRRWRRPATVSQQHLQKRRLSPTGRLNLGFITKGKLASVLITPSSWGSQQYNSYLSKNFWRRCTHHSSRLPLGVPSSVTHILARISGTVVHIKDFLAPLPGRKITSARGV